MKRTLFIAAFASLNLLGTIGCGNSGAAGGNVASVPSSPQVTSTTPLSVSASTYTLGYYQSAKIEVTGGTSPYTFTVTSGGGSVDSTSQWYTAPGTAGTISIKVRDASGYEGTVTLSVQASSGGDTTTTADCDDVVSASVSQRCSGNSNSSCSVNASFASHVPSGCKVTKLNVFARHFNSSGSCVYDASTAFTSNGTQGSGVVGKKTAYLDVTADLTAKTAVLTSTAYGWTSSWDWLWGNKCNGGTCNSCVSDVRFEIFMEAK